MSRLLLPLCSVFVLVCVYAHPQFRNAIPNGLASNREDSGITCAMLGHEPCKSGEPRNQFGLDFAEAKFKWTKELCEKDSDGDGLTNGDELGDPCCEWVSDKPNEGIRLINLSHPGDATEKNDVTPGCQKQTTTTDATPSPSSSGPNTNDTDSDDVCFPGHVNVQLRNGVHKAMRDVQVGDDVLVGVNPNRYSTVFMFTHRLDEKLSSYPFVTLNLEHANTSISLTKGHYIYTKRMSLSRADKVRVHDFVMTTNGWKQVQSISIETFAHGLYNPQTLDGDIYVNGIRASTYTHSIQPTTAHSLLAPMRAAFRYLWRASFSELFQNEDSVGRRAFKALPSL